MTPALLLLPTVLGASAYRRKVSTALDHQCAGLINP